MFVFSALLGPTVGTSCVSLWWHLEEFPAFPREGGLWILSLLASDGPGPSFAVCDGNFRSLSIPDVESQEGALDGQQLLAMAGGAESPEVLLPGVLSPELVACIAVTSGKTHVTSIASAPQPPQPHP